jgi:hypothetical protein
MRSDRAALTVCLQAHPLRPASEDASPNQE